MHQKHTFSLLSFLREHKKNKEGQVPVYLRITVDGKRSELSTKTYVDSRKWSAGKGRVKGTSEESRRLNSTIEAFEFRARDLYHHFLEKGKIITPELIKNEMIGLEHKKRTLVVSFDQFVREIELKIGNEYAAGTVKNWRVTQGHLKEFLEKSYGVMDIPFKSLRLQFLMDFDFYARTNWGCRTNAVMKHIQRIRKIVNKAIASEWLDKDPFISYEGKGEKTNRTFLTEEELKAVERKKIWMERLERVGDIFVFSCYTGLSYVDVEQLTDDHLVIGIDGKKWIYTFRQKSDGKSNVPLLPKALSIIEKYRNDPKCKRSGRLLPVITKIKTNEYLKEIAV